MSGRCYVATLIVVMAACRPHEDAYSRFGSVPSSWDRRVIRDSRYGVPPPGDGLRRDGGSSGGAASEDRSDSAPSLAIVETGADSSGSPSNEGPRTTYGYVPHGIYSAGPIGPWARSYGATNPNIQRVAGHVRADGTTVDPYFRTQADGITTNNFSGRGNVNPFTGQPGSR